MCSVSNCTRLLQLRFSHYIWLPGLVRLQDLFKMPANETYNMIVRKLEYEGDRNYRPLLKDLYKELKMKKVKQFRFLIDCPYTETYRILKQVYNKAIMFNLLYVLLVFI